MALTIGQLVMDEIISQLDEGKIKGLMILKYFYRPELELMPKVRIDRKFKTFKNSFNGKVAYSLATRVDDTNEEFFSSLENQLAKWASGRLGSNPKDFKLIKESKGYKKVYCKVLTTYSGEPRCLYSELLDGKHRHKEFVDSIYGSLMAHAL